jgi:hypothetical protein
MKRATADLHVRRNRWQLGSRREVAASGLNRKTVRMRRDLEAVIDRHQRHKFFGDIDCIAKR